MYPAWRGLTIFWRQWRFRISSRHWVRCILSSGITEASNVVIVAPLSLGQANMFSICFLDEDFNYGLLVVFGGGPDRVTLDDAYTDEMDMIGIDCILDATPHKSHFAFDMFGVSILEMDGDDSITDVATPGFIYVEGMFDPMDPPLSFDSMFGFVTRYNAPITQIHDIDDVGDPDGPLSGQSDCDSVSEEMKATPVSCSTELVDFGTSDQPRGLKIGSSLSLDENSRLINLLRDEKVRVCFDYKDLNKVSYKDDFSLAHINMLVDSAASHSMLSFMDGFFGVMPFGLKNTGATYQRVATTLFHDMMHKDVEFRFQLNPKKCTFGVTSRKLLGHIASERGIEVDPKKIRAILDMPTSRIEREIRGFLGRLYLMPPTSGCPLLLYLLVSDMALGCMLAQLDDSGKKSVRLAFSDHHRLMNNVVEYKACITSLKTVLDLGIRQLVIHVWGVDVIKKVSPKSSSGHEYILVAIDYFTKWVEAASYASLTAAKVAKFIRSHIICRYGIQMALWGVDVIRKVSPKSSSGHEYILVAIDYFTKWVEATSYASLTAVKVAKFIKSHIIYRYGIPHEFISDKETNRTVEVANKNIKRILQKMVETSQDWSEKLPFALWAYHTSFRTSIGATLFSLVYSMEVVLPVEIEVGSLRVALDHQIAETDWLRARYD
ncbi:hypothetical protein CK203_084011 [Vitis vinifera]|uniref:Integrase catalytic domain-containing protein n=1 Tax=Vitis vinifera TaxID=29760 RepID=A0A438EUS1_VITVI|nr:hypothetical protein CK203_084011 [Vitis vinifera]